MVHNCHFTQSDLAQVTSFVLSRNAAIVYTARGKPRHPWVRVPENVSVEPKTPRRTGGLRDRDRKQPRLGCRGPTGNVRIVAGSDSAA